MEKLFIVTSSRQPELTAAELEVLYGADSLIPFDGYFELKQKPDISLLGSAPRVGKILIKKKSIRPEQLPSLLARTLEAELSKDRKARVGLSSFISGSDAQSTGQLIYKAVKNLRKKGFKLGAVPNKAAVLNAAQVWHNQLDKDPNVELLLLGSLNSLVIARTIGVQNINDFSHRDRQKPYIDARAGMLPPKLARIMVNLAGNDTDRLIYDPFCGSGTVLMEAMVLGRNVAGSDISPAAVSGSQKNLDWLTEKDRSVNSEYEVKQADATKLELPEEPLAIVCETDLGPPLTSLPQDLEPTMAKLNVLISDALKNFASQIPTGTPLVIAIPAWYSEKSRKFVRLPLVDQLESLGYNSARLRHVPGELIYHRPGQIVARELLILRKG